MIDKTCSLSSELRISPLRHSRNLDLFIEDQPIGLQVQIHFKVCIQWVHQWTCIDIVKCQHHSSTLLFSKFVLIMSGSFSLFESKSNLSFVDKKAWRGRNNYTKIHDIFVQICTVVLKKWLLNSSGHIDNSELAQHKRCREWDPLKKEGR